MKKYDIFISYRRDGGDQSAKVIYDRLSQKGYHTFYDVETLRSGAFNTRLYSVIEECEDVLVVLSPGSLDRCNNEDDWVRLEIAHAFQCNKNVIPILLRDFTFPNCLPDDINQIRYQNGVQASVEFFDAFLERLCGFLKSKPGIMRSISRNISLRKLVIALGCTLLLAVGIWGAYIVISQNGSANSYPSTKEEKNEVKEIVYYIETNLTVADYIYYTVDNTMSSCESYLLEINEDNYNDLAAELNHAEDTINTQAEALVELPADLSASLENTDISVADLTALKGYINGCKNQYIDTLEYLKLIMNPSTLLDTGTKRQLVEINDELMYLDAELLFNGLCDVLLPVDDSALEEFRTKFLPTQYVISEYIDKWSKDEIELTSEAEAISTQQDKLFNEYSALVGNLNMETNTN